MGHSLKDKKHAQSTNPPHYFTDQRFYAFTPLQNEAKRNPHTTTPRRSINTGLSIIIPLLIISYGYPTLQRMVFHQTRQVSSDLQFDFKKQMFLCKIKLPPRTDFKL